MRNSKPLSSIILIGNGIVFFFLLLSGANNKCAAFTTTTITSKQTSTTSSLLSPLSSSPCCAASKSSSEDETNDSRSSRREMLQQTTSSIFSLSLFVSSPLVAIADDTTTTTIEGGGGVVVEKQQQQQLVNEIPMKDFIDPVGYFTIRVPKDFYAIRRVVKGDLPDEKTGKGRRGSSIFTAGNLAKAEVIAVERFPTRVLLEENGIAATGDLSTVTALGNPAIVATLVNKRREKDKPGGGANTILLRETLQLSADKKELIFELKNEIDVQKPELLLEQEGISQLFRRTVAKLSLNSNDGNIMAVFASALEQDFEGPDGIALQETVRSFNVIDRSTGA